MKSQDVNDQVKNWVVRWKGSSKELKTQDVKDQVKNWAL